jgi:hypothetical protein
MDDPDSVNLHPDCPLLNPPWEIHRSREKTFLRSSISASL